MAVTYEYVGKTGGTKVTEIPVNFISPPGIGTYDVVSVPVPAGRLHRVVFVIHSHSTTIASTTSFPEILVEGVNKGRMYGAAGVSVSSQGPVLIQVRRNSTLESANPSLTGTVYYWPTS